ncbi:MAG: type II toxin-antitoxin system VapC family toxin [Acidobacteriia bacterium]|nr:type II toxin-antitoxin system VapC family toxin [Terriglobia bacterium]
MEILLDTHALVWWMVESPRLSKRAVATLADPNNRLIVSAVVAWELAIKVNAGKILPSSLISRLEEAVSEQALEEMPITLEHAVRGGLLPLHHRDPFDRLLVAQAQSLKLPILSADAALDEYDVRRVW